MCFYVQSLQTKCKQSGHFNKAYWQYHFWVAVFVGTQLGVFNFCFVLAVVLFYFVSFCFTLFRFVLLCFGSFAVLMQSFCVRKAACLTCCRLVARVLCDVAVGRRREAGSCPLWRGCGPAAWGRISPLVTWLWAGSRPLWRGCGPAAWGRISPLVTRAAGGPLDTTTRASIDCDISLKIDVIMYFHFAHHEEPHNSERWVAVLQRCGQRWHETLLSGFLSPPPPTPTPTPRFFYLIFLVTNSVLNKQRCVDERVAWERANELWIFSRFMFGASISF